ncbi:TDT family transporter [Streptomyces parvulus]|uniref:SLAC1 family transporter n=1 Tax=Streptomyces parvulus TaxID=146923 RepID=UPI001E3390F5|nr:TDT family transporter [Streptomyces parvulus]MCC9157910.1 TDT family transporter [Streptomyces parvulus]MCE7690218.1 TDT family transporter [Streptomyces parvulus]
MTTFGIPLGLAGLAGAWSAAALELHAPAWPAELLYAGSSVLWIALTTAYAAAKIRHRGAFRADLIHPVAGPFTTLIPLVAILLTAHYAQYAFTPFAWLCGAAITTLALLTARLLARSINGDVQLNAFHAGYFIPLAAGPNIVSIALSSMHQHQASLAAAGAGLFFWVAMTTAMLIRAISGDRTPADLKPGTAAFLAAAATTNLAWLIAHSGRLQETQQLLTGVLVVMVLAQVFLLPEYRRLRFTQAWWIFTFPLAATANYTVRWMAAAHVPGWNIWAWSALLLATAFILYVAVRTVSALSLSRPDRQQAL